MVQGKRLEEQLLQARQDLKDSVRSLESAIQEVRTLTGLLPICSAGKKIRDDRGYWSEVETYIARYSGAEFTHGLCPDCAARLYSDPPPAADGSDG